MSSLTKATTSFIARQHRESTVSRPSCFGHLRGQNKLEPKRTCFKAVFGDSRFLAISSRLEEATRPQVSIAFQTPRERVCCNAHFT
jgi:hypothetical protein